MMAPEMIKSVCNEVIPRAPASLQITEEENEARMAAFIKITRTTPDKKVRNNQALRGMTGASACGRINGQAFGRNFFLADFALAVGSEVDFFESGHYLT